MGFEQSFWIKDDFFFNVFLHCRDLVVMVHLDINFHSSRSSSVEYEFWGLFSNKIS